MKWRIHQNSIRIRLSETDINNLAMSNELVESLHFGDNKYSYRLKLAETCHVILESDSMLVAINKKEFLDNTQVNIEWLSEEGLKVLVESDLYE